MKTWILLYMIIQDGVTLASHYAPASPYATGFDDVGSFSHIVLEDANGVLSLVDG
jgi:hypothetical protein